MRLNLFSSVFIDLKMSTGLIYKSLNCLQVFSIQSEWDHISKSLAFKIYKTVIMEVLSKTKMLLFYTFLYRKSNLKIGVVSIPNIVLNIAFTLPMLGNIFLMLFKVYISFEAGAGFKTISSSVFIAMGTMSVVCIYMCFAFKMDLIACLVDHLQDVVQDRMLQTLRK